MEYEYELYVGNVGNVWHGDSFTHALDEFYSYKKLSIEKYGRFSGEDVTLFKNGEIEKEHLG